MSARPGRGGAKSDRRSKIDVDSLKARISIEDLIEREGVELKRRGAKELIASCPFHSERTPSFTVTPAKQLYYCPGCGAGGDHIQFLMERHGLGFVEAAERLAEIAGGDVPAANDNDRRARTSRKAAPTAPTWIKSAAPDGAPPPPGALRVLRDGKWTSAPVVAHWAYRNAAGELLGYTCRVEFAREDGTTAKDVIPITWQTNTDTGESDWRQGALEEPRPLYGAELLAERPNAPVLIVEGEKACDAARRMLGEDGPVVITWPGGCKAVDKADWDMLAGREVVTGWPDTDSQVDKRAGEMRGYLEQPGMAAMLRIAEILAERGVEMQVAEVERPGLIEDGWDAADAEAEGWDGLAVAEWLAERSRPRQDVGTDRPAPPPAPPPPAAGPPPAERKRKAPPPGVDQVADRMPVRALGYRHGYYYYLSARQRQVHEYSAGAHGPAGLMQLAPLAYWSDAFAHGDTMKRDHWQAATDACMRLCERAGIFDSDLIRGRGCWVDKGRMVLNLGNRVLVDGRETDADTIGSDYIYEADTRLPGPRGTPLTVKECQRIIEIAKRFNWEMPASAALLAGWIVLAPICGALDWRPHVWLTGGTGTGKTTILNQFIGPLMAGMDVKVQGNSTEAGIRQRLRADARPVIFDESEKNDDREEVRVDAILSLVRQSSSDSDFHTLKGTTTGRVMKFHVRSMFCLASIQVGIKRQADHTRIAVLGLYGTSQVPSEEIDAHHDKWLQTERMLAELREDTEFGARLLQRSVSMVDVIRANMRTMVRVAAKEFRNQRLADTYGTLLAGAAALFYDHAISDDTALKFIRTFEWDAYHEAAREDESSDALSSVMQVDVRCDRERGSVTLSVGELVRICYDNSTFDGVSPSEARDHLGRLGLKVKRGIVGKDAGLLVANKSDRLRTALRGAPWAGDWKSYLLRVPGAKKHGVPITFAPGFQQRATFVPIEAVLSPTEQPE